MTITAARIVAGCALPLMLLVLGDGRAQSLAPAGCPITHCTAEATGVITQALIPTPLTTKSNSSLGSLKAEGCSGNGTQLTCLYARDTASAAYRGTLKLINATTLRPVWGSAVAANSYNLNAPTAAEGQVPVNFSDGSIAAGDAYYHVKYSAAGAVIGKLPLTGTGSNYGLTPISSTQGVVSQGNGTLTLVDMSAWQSLSTLTLTDPATGAPMTLVGPSSGTSNVLYTIGYNSTENIGILYSVGLNSETQQLPVLSSFRFTGRSGAAPVVVTPAVSGLPNNLVLVGVPGLIGDSTPQPRLLGMSDLAGTGLTTTWAVPLTMLLKVAPTIDQNSQSQFIGDGVLLEQYNLLTGGSVSSFNMQTLSGLPTVFRLNSHLGSSETASVFTLLLGAEVTGAQSGDGQYIMAFQPIASPNAVQWVSQLAPTAAKYSGGWNFAPSTQTGTVCPIAISINGNQSTIYRVCDH